MLSDLVDFLKQREERIKLGGRALVVRELSSAGDTEPMRDGVDVAWKVLVRCTFLESGESAFSDEDIPALKASSASKLGVLINAVNRVNGLNVEEEVKNSEAAQG